MSDYKVVPVSPTKEIIDAISVSARHRYTGSMIYSGLLHAAPDTGMVAVRRDWLLATLRGSRAAGWTIPLELQYLLDESDAEILKSWGGGMSTNEDKAMTEQIKPETIDNDLRVAEYLKSTGGNTPVDYIIIRLGETVQQLQRDLDSWMSEAAEKHNKLVQSEYRNSELQREIANLKIKAELCPICGKGFLTEVDENNLLMSVCSACDIYQASGLQLKVNLLRAELAMARLESNTKDKLFADAQQELAAANAEHAELETEYQATCEAHNKTLDELEAAKQQLAEATVTTYQPLSFYFPPDGGVWLRFCTPDGFTTMRNLDVVCNGAFSDNGTGIVRDAIAAARAAQSAPESRATEAKPGEDAIWRDIQFSAPAGSRVDVKTVDGSILLECIPQFNGDFYWNGAGREVFLNRTDVSHWRQALSTTPQAAE